MENKQYIAKLNNLRQGPRKVRLVADVIRKLPVKDAEKQLQLLNKRPSKPMLDLLKSAIANAEQQGAKREDLYVSSITVDAGLTLKRFMPRAHGRAFKIRQRASKIKLAVAVKSETKK